MNGTKIFNSTAQGILAKLLATENITVHVGNYRTAFFDTKHRILGLPTWNTKSKYLSDLLVGHEVGHALWTFDADVQRFKTECPKIPFSIYNIVEDIRIERMIQARYPGLVVSFNNGYDELYQDNFFKIKNRNVDELRFADRLNIKGKLGHRVSVRMSAAELAIFDRCQKARTFEEVLQIVKDIYEMVKAEPKPKKPKLPSPVSMPSKQKPDPKKPDPSSGADDSDDDEDGDEKQEEQKVAKKSPKKKEDKKAEESDDDSGSSSEEDGDSEESDSKTESAEEDPSAGSDQSDDEEESDGKGDESEEEDDDSKRKVGTDSDDNSDTDNSEVDDSLPYEDADTELTSETQAALDQKFAEMQSIYGANNQPLIMPSKEMMDKCIVPWKDVLARRMQNPFYRNMFENNSLVHEDWLKYKSKTKKQIQVLITEFERRKAAFQYTRAKVSETGEIDVNRLHSYKFTDEIFKSVTKLADAKSHGMVFILDFSGSMTYDIYNVFDQTLNLVMFCQAVGIPFQVVGFTTFTNVRISGPAGPGPSRHPNELVGRDVLSPWSFVRNQMSVSECNMFEILSSDMNKNDQELAMKHLRATIYLHETLTREIHSFSGIPFASEWEKMNQTPLLEAMACLHRIVEKFRARHHVQKMNVFVLTDGEGHKLKRGEDRCNLPYEKEGPSYGVTFQTMFYGQQLSIVPSSFEQTYANLVENLKVSMDCTVIGFYVSRKKNFLRKSGINSIIYSKTYPKHSNWHNANELIEKQAKTYRKNKCMFIPGGFNYDCYFLVDSHYAEIADDEEFDSDLGDEEFAGPIKVSTQNKLAKEFTEYTSNKRTSRILLTKLAELVS